MLGDMPLVPARQLFQGTRRPGRQGEKMPRAPWSSRRRDEGRRLQSNVRIRAAETEAVDARNAARDQRPGLQTSGNRHARILKRNARVQLAQMELAGDFSVLQTKHHLRQ